jgi:hypothetical protein
MAAGDSSDLLVARVRTYLDEITEGFFKDSEIFASLNDAQNEIVSQLLNVWKQKQIVNFDEPIPEVLSPVVVVATLTRASAKVYALPTNYLQYLSVADNSGVMVNIRRNSLGKVAKATNTYLKAASGSDYCSIGSTVITENTDSASLSLTYVKVPTTITTSVDPDFTSQAFQIAMVQYAFADLLKKDYRLQESLQEFQKFLSMVANLYV